MKIIKAIIEGVYIHPPNNEPYKSTRLLIATVTHFYKDGSHDVFLNYLFGNIPTDGFYQILDNDCEVELKIKDRIDCDKYYERNDFKNACYNKENDNPYQLPDWKTIK